MNTLRNIKRNLFVEAANRYFNEEYDKNNYVYGEILSIQNDDANEFFDIMDNAGEEQALKYFSQWDNNDYTQVYADYNKVIGSSDDVYENDNYIMSYNKRHGYASLYVKLDKDDFITRYGDKDIIEGADGSNESPKNEYITLKFFASNTEFLQNRYKGSDRRYYVLQWTRGYDNFPFLYTATKSWEPDTPINKVKINFFDFPEGHEAYFYMLKENKDIE